MPLRLFVPALVFATSLFAADPVLQSAQAKVDRLADNQMKPGETVFLSPAEINAWVAAKIPGVIPHGIRDSRVEFGTDTSSASAIADFQKIGQSRGISTGWAIGKLIEGERPLKISVRVASGDGKIAVYLTRVELSGVGVEGTVLDILIRTFFVPLYPDAKIGEPVDFDYNIDHIQIRPDGLRIVIKK